MWLLNNEFDDRRCFRVPVPQLTDEPVCDVDCGGALVVSGQPDAVWVNECGSWQLGHLCREALGWHFRRWYILVISVRWSSPCSNQHDSIYFPEKGGPQFLRVAFFLLLPMAILLLPTRMIAPSFFNSPRRRFTVASDVPTKLVLFSYVIA